jgi:uncharacterized protein (DUF1501 family)
MTRREFLSAAGAAGCVFAGPYQRAAKALAKKVKITDVKCMIVRGTWDWNLIKVETDSGLYGIGEAYWGWGVKDLVLNKMKGIVVGEDPLNVDKLYNKMLLQSAGVPARFCSRAWRPMVQRMASTSPSRPPSLTQSGSR